MFSISIKCDNDAFGTTVGETAEEIARIIREAADKIIDRSYEIINDEQAIILYDSNGNKVGRATYVIEEE